MMQLRYSFAFTWGLSIIDKMVVCDNVFIYNTEQLNP